MVLILTVVKRPRDLDKKVFSSLIICITCRDIYCRKLDKKKMFDFKIREKVLFYTLLMNYLENANNLQVMECSSYRKIGLY